ncbi:spore germination protein [Bacillus cereus]|uniref:spore germination protein n=1 Tax=Bacillus cereus TaxID=1396 RepID=UPI002852B903|nr:spore germination protein [Bacillus cereus]WLE91058.1 Spore germination protein YndE [Bacillus cereus]
MSNPQERITTAQTFVIITNFILGSGILSLPRTSVEKVKTPDVWISVILSGLLAMLAGYIIIRLSQNFPKQTFYQYNQKIVGKWMGSILSLCLIGYFLAEAGFQINYLARVTNFFLIGGTPIWAIIMPFMWISLYAIMSGINSIARLFEIIFPITIFIFLLVLFMSIGIFELDNLRPVLGLGFLPVLHGLKTTTLAFTGPEIMLIIFVFMEHPNQASKAMFAGILVPLIIYVITVVMVIGAFSIDGVVTRTWPTMDLMRSFEISGLLFERFESLFLVIWIMKIFTTYTICYYAAALGLAQLFKKNIQTFIFTILPIIYIIAVTTKNINTLHNLEGIISRMAFYLVGVMPLVLVIIVQLKGGYGEE